jgi:hypothetical protein
MQGRYSGGAWCFGLWLSYYGVARILFLTGSIGTNGEERIETLAVKCSDRLKTPNSESIPQECSH